MSCVHFCRISMLTLILQLRKFPNIPYSTLWFADKVNITMLRHTSPKYEFRCIWIIFYHRTRLGKLAVNYFVFICLLKWDRRVRYILGVKYWYLLAEMAGFIGVADKSNCRLESDRVKSEPLSDRERFVQLNCSTATELFYGFNTFLHVTWKQYKGSTKLNIK